MKGRRKKEIEPGLIETSKGVMYAEDMSRPYHILNKSIMF